MADQPRKSPTNDLPPKNVARGDEEKVKGGAAPINDRKRPVEPIND